jgi:hypothetical protein
MENPPVKIKGGVVGAKRVLAVIAESDEDELVRECLKELFVYELANDMRGSNRYKPEYEKRIGKLSENFERGLKRVNNEN